MSVIWNDVAKAVFIVYLFIKYMYYIGLDRNDVKIAYLLPLFFNGKYNYPRQVEDS